MRRSFRFKILYSSGIFLHITPLPTADLGNDQTAEHILLLAYPGVCLCRLDMGYQMGYLDVETVSVG